MCFGYEIIFKKTLQSCFLCGVCFFTDLKADPKPDASNQQA